MNCNITLKQRKNGILCRSMLCQPCKDWRQKLKGDEGIKLKLLDDFMEKNEGRRRWKMKKYRKKPVVIEAMQLTRKYFNVCKHFIGDSNITHSKSGEFAEDDCYIVIKTLEGQHIASELDWLIKGVKGEFYPCKPEIFEMTYELVENE